MNYSELKALKTTTRLLVIGFGSCGINSVVKLMEESPIDQNPHLGLAMVESNTSSMQAALAEQTSKNVQEWLQKDGAVQFFVLGITSFGMGGKSDDAASAATSHQKALEALIESYDIIILYGGAGGGTAGAMSVYARIIAEKGKTLCATITMPAASEGLEAGAKADRLHKELLDICPTGIIYNENVTDKKNLSPVGAWQDINKKALFPNIRFMRAIILTQGQRDIDKRDIDTTFEGGNHMLWGFIDMEDGGEVDEDFLKRLFCNQYLQKEILDYAVEVRFWFIGRWSLEDTENIMNYVHKRVREHGGSANIKPGIHEDSFISRAVGFLAIAKTLPTTSTQSITIPDMPLAMLPSATRAVTPDENKEEEERLSKEPLLRISGLAEGSIGDIIEAEVPASVAQEYNRVFAKKSVSQEEIVDIRKKIAKWSKSKSERFFKVA